MSVPEAGRILYVEDQVLIQITVEEGLRDAGFDPMVASNGADGLALLEEHHACLKGLVTDVGLGDGASGWDIARRARQLHPELPIVYASGGCARDWFAQGVPLSIMVEKPFIPTQIVVAMASLLNRPLH